MRAEGSILNEASMQESVDVCRSDVDNLQTMLYENKSLQELLEQKRIPYISVARNCAKLYEINVQMQISFSFYNMSFPELLELVVKIAKARYRGKGNLGKNL